MKQARNVDCPCGTGKPYAACCEPFHAGAREAPDPERLMRSRYSAFALGLGEYLWRTLHADHDSRARPKAQEIASLEKTFATLRYVGLEIFETRDADADGVAQVLFCARVRQGAKDLSFVELSDFVHDGEGWRYLQGQNRPASALRGKAISIAAFLRP